MTLALASIHLYPVKSLGGYAVEQAALDDRGFVGDRRWMLIDANGRFISQREVPEMALLHCTPTREGTAVVDTRSGDRLLLPRQLSGGTSVRASVWDDVVDVLPASRALTDWFTQRLPLVHALVHFPNSSVRSVDPKFAIGNTTLSDGFPFLLISQASLDDLNAKLPAEVPMDRFRPNLVVSGGHAFQEDSWKEIAIGNAKFKLVKPCARCVIPTTDQHTAMRSAEPLRTLSRYRRSGNNVLFGMNAMGSGAIVRVGDLVAPLA